jgi:hypothetical protein
MWLPGLVSINRLAPVDFAIISKSQIFSHLCRAVDNINETCTAAFKASPVPATTCIDNGAHSLSEECLAAYGEYLDFPVDNLTAITQPYREIHVECLKITDGVRHLHCCIAHCQTVSLSVTLLKCTVLQVWSTQSLLFCVTSQKRRSMGLHVISRGHTPSHRHVCVPVSKTLCVFIPPASP